MSIMRTPFLTLIKKDLKGYFDQPTGYILIVVFAALLSYWFFQSALLAREASLRDLFTVEFAIDHPSMPWLLTIFVPAATMRLLAEEQRDGTLEILLTQPIRGWIVLVAKFAAGLIFVTIAIMSTAGIPIALMTAGDIDEGAVISQYIGSIFLSAALVAIGLFTSSLTRNQIVAFILGLTVSMVIMVMGLDIVATSLPSRASILLQSLSPITHFSSIGRGIIDLRDILYFLALISTFLSATFLIIRSKTLSHHSAQFRNLQLGVLGLIVLSLLVGWFGTSIKGRIDLTEDKLFSLSEGSQQIIQALDDVLTLELYESANPPIQVSLISRDVKDFLEDFAANSDGKVELIKRYADRDEESARRAQLAGVPPVQFNVQSQGELQIKTGYLGLVLTYLDRREVIPFVSSVDGFEYRLATLTNKMISQNREQKKIAFFNGFGTKTTTKELRTFSSLLEDQYVVTEVTDTGDQPFNLDNIDIFILAGPKENIPDRIRTIISSFIEAGGKAMILVDPVLIDERQMTGIANTYSFSDFLHKYGIIVEDDLVFDLRANETLPFSTQLGSVYLQYPYWIKAQIVDTKIGGSVDSIIVPWASSVGIAETNRDAIEITPILQSTEYAAIDFAYRNLGPDAPIFEEVTESSMVQSTLAVALENRNPDGRMYRMIVAGDSDWISEVAVQRSQENIALGLNLIDWLAQEDTLAGIRSKTVSARNLVFSSSLHKNLVQYLNIGGVPTAFIILGLIRFTNRRRTGVRRLATEDLNRTDNIQQLSEGDNGK